MARQAGQTLASVTKALIRSLEREARGAFTEYDGKRWIFTRDTWRRYDPHTYRLVERARALLAARARR